MAEHFLPIAVWYGGGRIRATMVRPPSPGDTERWKQDLANIARCGFNAVRCWVDWASAEPHPGDYHFEALDLVMALAGESRLKVILQLYLDSAPDWLGLYYPDSRYVAASGAAITSQGSPGYCYDHPGVRAAAEQFMRTLASHVAQHPAFLAWDLWSEPHIVQWSYLDFLPQPVLFCYCHYTVLRFRRWLRDRYRDLEVLNTVWYRRFSCWDEVEPPRFLTLMNYTAFLDWQRFMLDKLAEDLRWRHEAIRQVDPHLTTSHAAVPSLLTLPIDSYGSPDDWRMADQVDIWGTSLYPKHVTACETQRPFFRAAMLTAIRSACDAAGKPFWLGELQGGHGYVGAFAAPVTEGDIRMYAWQALAHGAKGLNFYAWYPMDRGYESAGFGLANLDGTPSERALSAGAVARIVSQHMDLFYNIRPVRAYIAICWNVLSNMMWASMRQYNPEVPSRSYVGLYKALYEERVPVDFIHVDQIAAGKLKDYGLLYLPFSWMLPRSAGAAIETFVRDGKIVVAEARLAWNNEDGGCEEAIPGLGLARVFGCRERWVASLGEGDFCKIRILKEHPAFPLLRAGDILHGALFVEELEPIEEGAEVVGVFEGGGPAIVAHRYGRGWAILVGTLASLAFYRLNDEATGRFLKGFARLAEIEPPVLLEGLPSDAEVEAQLLEGQMEKEGLFYLLMVLNHTKQSWQPRIGVRLPQGPWEAVDLLTQQPLFSSSIQGRMWISGTLRPEDVWLIQWRPVDFRAS